MLKQESLFAHLLTKTIYRQAENTIYSSSYRLRVRSCKAQAMFEVCVI